MDDIKLSTLKTLARKAFLLEALENKKAVTWCIGENEKTFDVFIAREGFDDSLYCAFPSDEIDAAIDQFTFDRNASNRMNYLSSSNSMEYLANKKDAKKPKPAPRKPCKSDVKKYTPSLNGKGENLNVVI